MKNQLIEFTGPIIFVSNFQEIQDPALLSRLNIVFADKPYWMDAMYKVPQVKPKLEPLPPIDYTEEDNNMVHDEENVSFSNTIECCVVE